MGLWMRVKSLFARPSQRSWQVAGWQTSPMDVAIVMGMDPAELWRTQPHLRTVTDFVARNVAQLGLHAYDRVSDTDRRRVGRGPLPALLRRPNPDQTLYELVYALVADMALYDQAFWWVTRTSAGEWMIRPIPAAWGPIGVGGTVFSPAEYWVHPPHAVEPMSIPADQLIVFHGWDPGDPSQGSSKVHALKLILSEQIHAYTYREQVWRRGGRVSSVITRPADAPEWSPKAKEKFRRDWQSQYTKDGPDAGGTPILEDGMTLNKTAFSAREDQFVDAATLSLTTVASVFQVNPTMVGVLDNANYSNVREFRRMLYGDSLGPWLTMIQDRLNNFLLPRMGEPDRRYVEFNLAEKLRGSFEEQAAVLQASVGRPWMTADEARALQNMPAIGGDAQELVTPLNVLIGGQASPQDSAPPPEPDADAPPRETGAVVLGKARTVRANPVRADTYEKLYERRLTAFFEKQRDAVLAAYGSAKRGPVRIKAVPGWDAEAWNTELAGLLLQLGLAASTAAAHQLLETFGLPLKDYDADRTIAWLTKMAGGVAEGINGATLFELEAALADTDRTDPDGRPVPAEERMATVFDTAIGSRAVETSASLVTAVSGFGSTEAVRQRGGEAMKTWRTRSVRPRSSHRALDGQTVGIDEPFSNGAMWPADSSLDPDERAGCKCAVEIALQVP